MTGFKNLKEYTIGNIVFISAFLVLLVSLVITIAVWFNNQNLLAQRSRLAFDDEAERIRYFLDDQLNNSLHILFGARGLFAASIFVEPGEWKTYVQGTGATDPGSILSSLDFVEKVPRRLKSVFEENTGLTIYPTETKAEYFIVKYSEPDRMALGFDLSSDQNSIEALNQAIHTGQPAATHVTNLVGGQRGFTVFLPIYKNELPITTLEERRAALSGFITAVVSLDKLAENLLSRSRILATQSNFEVFDAEGFNAEYLIFDSNPSQLDVMKNEGFYKTIPIRFAGHFWNLYITGPLDIGLNPADARISLIFLFGGTAFSTVLFFLVYFAGSARSRAIKIAEHMTKTFAENEKYYTDLIRKSPDPIIQLDEFGFLKLMNWAAEKISGYKSEELLGRHFTEVGVVIKEDLPKAIDAFTTIMSGKPLMPYELTMIRKDGSKFVVEVNSGLIKNGGKAIVHIIFREITERKKLEEELKSQIEQLETLNRIMVGRELKMVELKKEIDALKDKLKQ